MTNEQNHSDYCLLIVDDDDDILTLLSKQLKSEGFRIETAKSAEEALKTIAVVNPQLILTDLFMSGMNGMQLLTEIHADNPLLPVIIFSGQAQIPDAVKATHLGCSAFLTKPIQQNVLMKQVNYALRLSVGKNQRKFWW